MSDYISPIYFMILYNTTGMSYLKFINTVGNFFTVSLQSVSNQVNNSVFRYLLPRNRNISIP